MLHVNSGAFSNSSGDGACGSRPIQKFDSVAAHPNMDGHANCLLVLFSSMMRKISTPSSEFGMRHISFRALLFSLWKIRAACSI